MITTSTSVVENYPNHVQGLVEAVDAIEEYYDMGKTIGKGEFAKVKVARCKATQQLVRTEKYLSYNPMVGRWPSSFSRTIPRVTSNQKKLPSYR